MKFYRDVIDIKMNIFLEGNLSKNKGYLRSNIRGSYQTCTIINKHLHTCMQIFNQNMAC